MYVTPHMVQAMPVELVKEVKENNFTVGDKNDRYTKEESAVLKYCFRKSLILENTRYRLSILEVIEENNFKDNRDLQSKAIEKLYKKSNIEYDLEKANMLLATLDTIEYENILSTVIEVENSGILKTITKDNSLYTSMDVDTYTVRYDAYSKIFNKCKKEKLHFPNVEELSKRDKLGKDIVLQTVFGYLDTDSLERQLKGVTDRVNKKQTTKEDMKFVGVILDTVLDKETNFRNPSDVTTDNIKTVRTIIDRHIGGLEGGLGKIFSSKYILKGNIDLEKELLDSICPSCIKKIKGEEDILEVYINTVSENIRDEALVTRLSDKLKPALNGYMGNNIDKKVVELTSFNTFLDILKVDTGSKSIDKLDSLILNNKKTYESYEGYCNVLIDSFIEVYKPKNEKEVREELSIIVSESPSYLDSYYSVTLNPTSILTLEASKELNTKEFKTEIETNSLEKVNEKLIGITNRGIERRNYVMLELSTSLNSSPKFKGTSFIGFDLEV